MTQKDKAKEDRCEWCDLHYPRINGKSTFIFWEVELFGKYKHKICDDCKNHLKEVK